MSSTQSLTAVVTDIRKIEMRYYPVPEAAQTANPKDFIDIVRALSISFTSSIGPTSLLS
jgi:hypothetical protein